MPGITIERPKMTRVMYQALKRHIMRDRERKKQGQWGNNGQKRPNLCGQMITNHGKLG